MKKKQHILFTATFSTSFITEDLAILRSHFPVHAVIASGVPAFFRYLRGLLSASITFSWFASVYSTVVIALGRMMGKRSILILGGADVAKMPEIGYGIWNSPWKASVVAYGIRLADVVVAVDPSIRTDAHQLLGSAEKPISIIPTGHDHMFWTPHGEKERFVLTVAHCGIIPRFKIKGIDFLFETARSAPEIHFVLIGVSEEMLTMFPPPANVECFGFLRQFELLSWYRRAAVYFQPSLREALGSTLCEAMLCGCYPVGTNVGGIPTVIGSDGALVPFGDVPSAVSSLRSGLSQPVRPEMRERIIAEFSMERRERELRNLIEQVAHDRR